MPCRAQQLLDLGQSVWLDYIHRRELRSGVFAAQVRDQGVLGVTSNPTIFQQAIGQSTDYDDAIRAGLARDLAGVPLYESLAIEDVQAACDALLPVFEKSGGLDGHTAGHYLSALSDMIASGEDTPDGQLRTERIAAVAAEGHAAMRGREKTTAPQARKDRLTRGVGQFHGRIGRDIDRIDFGRAAGVGLAVDDYHRLPVARFAPLRGQPSRHKRTASA